MAYDGEIATIPLGQGGLYTDDPQTITPITNVIKANNISFTFGSIEKVPGAIQYTKNFGLSSGVGAFFDWWPNDISQRLIVCAKNGKIYRYRTTFEAATEITPSGSAPATLGITNQTYILTGGSESLGRNRKLFIYTGSNTPQVISGDGTTRSNMSKPAADWTGSNQPFFGIIHRGFHFAFGNRNLPHQAYRSLASDHEDFQSTGIGTYTIYPGESEKLMTGFVYKNALYVVKYPLGLYQLIDSDNDPNNWYFAKVTDEFGAGSPHASAPIIQDQWVANSNGSISSASQVNAFGNIRSGDVFWQLRCEQFMRQNTNQQGLLNRHMLWYSDKKTILAAYQSAGGLKNDLLCFIDLNGQAPKVSWANCFQPNCLGLIKDVQGVGRPAYGSDDGFVYLLDRADRSVAGTKAYLGEFQTIHTDFVNFNVAYQPTSNVAEFTKMYDFVEPVFDPTGDFDLNMDVFIDGSFKKTLVFNVSSRANLDTIKLDSGQLDSGAPKESRRPIQLQGRRISFRCYNSGLNQNFKLSKILVYFRRADQAQRPVGGS